MKKTISIVIQLIKLYKFVIRKFAFRNAKKSNYTIDLLFRWFGKNMANN